MRRKGKTTRSPIIICISMSQGSGGQRFLEASLPLLGGGQAVVRIMSFLTTSQKPSTVSQRSYHY